MSLGRAIGGFAQGFFQAKRQKEQKEERDQEIKLRTKLVEMDMRRDQALLEQMREQQDARKQLTDFIASGGVPAVSNTPGAAAAEITAGHDR
jgi:hypothetical protein